MYLGTQFGARTDADYQTFKQLGVNHINGFPDISHHNWTVNNHGESIAMYILGGYASVTYPFREANSAAIVPLFRQNNTFVYLRQRGLR